MTDKVQFEKYKPLVTPKGVARYPWLSKPDDKFNKLEFNTGLLLDPEEPEAKKLLGILDKIVERAAAAVKAEDPKGFKASEINPAYTPELDENKEPTGRVLIRAKTKAKQTMKSGEVVDVELTIVDSAKNKLPKGKAVYGGSELKLAVRPAPYFMPPQKRGKTEVPGMIGVTLYLLGVQVIHLVSGGDAASMFDTEEGDVFDSEDVFDTAEPKADADDDSDDDDLY